MVAKTEAQIKGKQENHAHDNGTETGMDLATPIADPFAYGYRVVAEAQADGTLAYPYVPLSTPSTALNSQRLS